MSPVRLREPLVSLRPDEDPDEYAERVLAAAREVGEVDRMKVAVTFGSQYSHETHPVDERITDKSYVVFEGATLHEARTKAFERLGTAWAFDYEWEDFQRQITEYNLHEVVLEPAIFEMTFEIPIPDLPPVVALTVDVEQSVAERYEQLKREHPDWNDQSAITMSLQGKVITAEIDMSDLPSPSVGNSADHG